MRTNFVLIYSENVKPEYIEKLKHEHFRVVVFVGANLKRLNFPSMRYSRLVPMVAMSKSVAMDLAPWTSTLPIT